MGAKQATGAAIVTGISLSSAPDRKEAERFLTLLDEQGNFCFAVIEHGNNGAGKSFSRSGSLEEHFPWLDQENQNGACVFVVINETTGRKDEDVTRIRAVFADQDEPSDRPIEDWPLDPHLVVETSPGKYHYYWSVDGLKTREFSAVQEAIASVHKTDVTVKNPARLMRLPGFLNCKREKDSAAKKYDGFRCRIVQNTLAQSYSAEQVRIAFPPVNAKTRTIAPQTDRVLSALQEQSLYLKDAGHGIHWIHCPWQSEHTTDGGDGEAAYIEPHTNGYSSAAFRCFHAHCANRSIKDLWSHLGLSAFKSIDQPPISANSVLLPTSFTTYPESARMLYPLAQRAGTLYRQSDQVVRLSSHVSGPTCIQEVKGPGLVALIDETVGTLGGEVLAWVKTKDGKDLVPKRCQTTQATSLLEAHAQIKEHLDPLGLVTNAPILTPDGEVLGQGYHRQSGGVYVCRGDYETEIHLEEAVDGLFDHLQDFEFFKDSDRSRAIAHLLGPALRQGSILTYLPADLIEATESQSGKGTLCEATHAIYGNVGCVISQRRGGVGSLDEQIDAAMLQGRAFICLDNYRGKLDSPHLEALLTARENSWQARAPYRHPTTVDPSRFCFHITSNGLQLTPDLLNRVNIIKLRKRPPGYRFQYGSKEGYLQHTVAEREYLLGCIFTVIKEWIRQDKPQTETTGHNFLAWSRTLDWIVQHLFDLPPLLTDIEDFGEIQKDPALMWLRSVSIHMSHTDDVQRWWGASEIADEIDGSPYEANRLPIGANGRDVGSYHDENQRNQQIGRILGRLFKEVPEDKNQLATRLIDGFAVTRLAYQDQYDRSKKRYVYLFCPDDENTKTIVQKALEDRQAAQLP